MRILQSRVNVGYITGSPQPAYTLRTFAFGTDSTTLIDDSGLSTKVRGFTVTDITNETGIVFVAKDARTLARGFRELAHKKGGIGLRLNGQGGANLAVLGVEWTGNVRSTNQFTVGMTTVMHNVRAAMYRGAYKVGIGTGSQRRVSSEGGIFGDGPIQSRDHVTRTPGGDTSRYVYESVSENLDQISRDNRLGIAGAAMFVCPVGKMPVEVQDGSVYRQLGSTMDCGTLAAVVGNLF